jgi:uncharacterized coiled-coil protein SlyX
MNTPEAISMSEILSIGTMVSVVAFFLKDLFFGHKKNTMSIHDLATITSTIVATLGKLESTIATLQDTVHKVEKQLERMIPKKEHYDELKEMKEITDRLDKRLIEVEVTQKFRKVEV